MLANKLLDSDDSEEITDASSSTLASSSSTLASLLFSSVVVFNFLLAWSTSLIILFSLAARAYTFF
jgi:hypothetical protein